MENAVDALKIAFAMMMFVMALSLSISSFSNASSAITEITSMRDRETEYTYVNPSENLTRTVGIETVITTMYRAYEENIAIYFIQASGNPLDLYYATDTTGEIKKDDHGDKIKISCIDLSNEGFATKAQAQDHLDIILGGEKVLNSKSPDVQEKHKEKLIYENGLYDKFKNAEFEESLGEYEHLTGASKIKKRVITYKLQ